jgi:DNA gyrase subunit A
MADPVQKHTPVNIEDEMKRSYMDYAMSVIIGRALPDARDGLKPAHRRVLYGMKTMGLSSTRGYRKCAKIVGEVMGNFHPHGDASIYDTLVRLAQDFNMRYPLVNGQGNFGSIDGDPPAAMRYTEARLQALADDMMGDLDKETVDFVPNYDETTEEPTVLPAPFPNLLVNGSAGIAVGMATNVPPHNLGELVDAVHVVAANPDCTVDELLEKIPGPDFPTGALICGIEGIRSAYATGRGSITLRARAGFEDTKRGGRSIIVTEIPYMVNKASLVERIAELVNEGKIDGVSDLRDESNRHGIRVVIELKKDTPEEVVLNQLYKQTPLQTTFGVNMLALVGGRPRLLSLREAIQHFLDFRREVVARRAAYDLAQAEARAHILEGFAIALDQLDAVIATIRAADDAAEARSELMARFALSERQAQAILDMRLRALTALERQKVQDELAELRQKIAELEALLASDEKVLAVILEELDEI